MKKTILVILTALFSLISCSEILDKLNDTTAPVVASAPDTALNPGETSSAVLVFSITESSTVSYYQDIDDETLKTNLGTITVQQGNGASAGAAPVISSATLDAANKKLRISLVDGTNLISGNILSITLPENQIKDLEGNGNQQTALTVTIMDTSADTTAPVVASTPDTALTPGTTSTTEIVFSITEISTVSYYQDIDDETLKTNLGTITVQQGDGASTGTTPVISSASLDAANKKLRISLVDGTNLISGNILSITLPENQIKDLEGNGNQQTALTVTIMDTSADTTAPVVASTPDTALTPGTTSTTEIVFSITEISTVSYYQDIDDETLKTNLGTITVQQGDGASTGTTPVISSASLDAANKKLRISLDDGTNLILGNVLSITLPENQIKDLAGNGNQQTSLTVTIIDTTAPVVASVPDNALTPGVTSTTEIVFSITELSTVSYFQGIDDNALKTNLGTITVQQGNGVSAGAAPVISSATLDTANKKLRISLVDGTNLISDNILSITLPENQIKDLAGNGNQQTSLTLTILDTIAPVVASTSDNALSLGVTSTAVIAFTITESNTVSYFQGIDDNVLKTNLGTITVQQGDGASAGAAPVISSATLDAANKKLRISLVDGTNLILGNILSITLPENQIKDLEGNGNQQTSLTVTIMDDPSMIVIETYLNNSKLLHQSIKDDTLADTTELVTVSNIPDGSYTFTFGNISGSKTATNKTLTITKADIKASDAQDGTELTLFYKKNIVLATYRPYEIHTWQDLQAMRHDLTGNYIIMENIWFDEAYDDPLFPLTGFEPIGLDEVNGVGENKNGFQGTPFTGTLDGQNNLIIGLVINKTTLDYAGLFGKISAPSNDIEVVKDLGLINPGLRANAIAGTLVGYLEKGTVTNVGVKNSYDIRSTYFQGKFNRFPDFRYSGLVETFGYAIPIDVPQITTAKASSTDISEPLLDLSLGFLMASLGADDDFGYTGGLAGIVGEEASLMQVYNIELLVKAKYNSIGGIAGSVRTNGKLYGGSTAETIGEAIMSGGLVGSSYGGIVIGTNFGKIIGNTFVGGLVGVQVEGVVAGYNRKGRVQSLHFTESQRITGGLIGALRAELDTTTVVGWFTWAEDEYTLEIVQPFVGVSLLKDFSGNHSGYWLKSGYIASKPDFQGDNPNVMMIESTDMLKLDSQTNLHYKDTNLDNTKQDDEPIIFNDNVFKEFFDVNENTPSPTYLPALKNSYLSVKVHSLPTSR